MNEISEIIDLKPEESDFKKEVVEDLESPQKRIRPKFFYDEEGSSLFVDITKLPEYYLTRAEKEILETQGPDIGRNIGEGTYVVELGSGNGIKSALLLKCLTNPAGYMLVDISMDSLRNARKLISASYPNVPLKAVCADYNKTDVIGQMDIPGKRAIVFLGSTIGNMEPDEARGFIAGCRKLLSDGESLTIGSDLKKDKAILERAYNDSAGVTAKFNLNLIKRINRELGAQIPKDAFTHRAFYNEDIGRIEMHLESTRRQSFEIGGHVINFEKGETIHTENSYKFSVEEFTRILNDSGFQDISNWEDSRKMYALFTAKIS